MGKNITGVFLKDWNEAQGEYIQNGVFILRVIKFRA
jgi:hypothetical protein